MYVCMYKVICIYKSMHTYTHTHTHTYIYIYIDIVGDGDKDNRVEKGEKGSGFLGSASNLFSRNMNRFKKSPNQGVNGKEGDSTPSSLSPDQV
jgi:hypothetical protein